MAGIIDQGLDVLLRNGLVEIIIFGLIYVIIFAILRNVGLFAGIKKGDASEKKKEKRDKVKKIHALIALVLGILSILPHHYAPFSSYDIIPIIERAIPNISLMVLGILCALLIVGIFGTKLGGQDGNPIRLFIFVGIIIFVAWIFMEASRRYRLPGWVNPELGAVVIALVVFAAIVMWIMGPDDKKAKDFKGIFDGDKVDWKKAKTWHAMQDFFGRKKP